MPARSKFVVLLLAFGAVAAIALLAHGLQQHATDAAPELEAGTVLPEPRVLPEFSLLDHQGRPFERENLAGRWTLVFAGFTHCPDICPMTLAILASLDQKLREQDVEVQTLFVTVDPARDDVATLAQYVTHFSPRIIAATGDEAEIRTLMDGLGFTYIKVPMGGGNYTVDHTAALALVDPHERVSAYFMPPLRSNVLAADLASLAVSNPAAPSASASGSFDLEITEWEVPYENARPRDPFRGPDGRVWFVGQTGDYAATLDPESGEFERIELPEGAGPHTIIVNEAGAWYAGNRAAHIGRIDLSTGKIDAFATPEDEAGDPHTMAFDAKGNIWFTSQHANAIGHLDVETRQVRVFPLSTPRARPYGLELDPDGRPWAVLFGTHRLATVDPASGEVEEIVLPREEARPRRIAITDDGRIWYVDFVEGYLGAYDPRSGEFAEWQSPGGPRAGLYAMGADANGRLWMVETGEVPNRFVGFDPATGRFGTPIEVPGGAGVVRHMSFDERTNGFWFGTDFNTIGHAVVR